MKHKLSVFVTLFLGILIACSGLAYADELKDSVGSLNALNSGYAITRWPWDGGQILVGEDATVRACTTITPIEGSTATQVVFRWIRPNGSSWDSDPKDLALSSDTWDGDPIYDAYDTQTIDMLGDWGVQALFIGDDGKLKGPNPYPIMAIRAISWHAVPEVPFGTVAAVIALFGALAVFGVKSKKLNFSRVTI